MALNQIAAVIIARDAQDTIKRTLDALRTLPEVVVYDNGSGDATAEIAGTYPNCTVHHGRFEGFGPTRNRAAALAARDWIFSIDADEWPDETLLASLASADLSDPEQAYACLRENRFMGRAVHRGGWGKEWKTRLYNRRSAGFEPVAVHERVEVPASGRLTRLGGLLIHDNIHDIGQFLDKINRYSELRAQTSERVIAPPWIVLRAAWAFLRSYLLQLGFLAGWRGLVIAWSNANGVFYKYMKAYAKSRPPARGG